MIGRCLACETVFEPDDDPADGLLLCPECVGRPPTAAREGVPLESFRTRCPACGLAKDVPTYRKGETLRCAQCRVLYPAEEALTSPADPVPTVPAAPARPIAAAPATAPAWWIRILQGSLLLSLVPLAWIIAFPGESPTARLQRMVERDPSLAKPLEAARDDSGVLQALPDQRIDGALLSHGSRLHWACAAAAALAWTLYFGIAWPRGRAAIRHLLLVAAFTSTAGIFLLWAVQLLAELAQEYVVVRGGWMTVMIWAVLRFIAFSYRAALDPDNGFLASLGGFTFGVGLCEEVCKLLPLVVHVRSASRGLDWRGLVAWALFSGMGFGIAEGIHYGGEMYNGIYAAPVYLVRFLPCVALHAAWTGISAVYLYRNPEPIVRIDAWYEWAPVVIFPALPSILLHGLYDTLLKREMDLWALAVAVGSCALFLRLIEQTRMRQQAAMRVARTRREAVGGTPA